MKNSSPFSICTDAVVSAVYINRRQKDSHKNSFISSCNNKSTVIKHMKDEFDIEADIAACKRLRQHINGEIQPLLVV